MPETPTTLGLCSKLSITVFNVGLLIVSNDCWSEPWNIIDRCTSIGLHPAVFFLTDFYEVTRTGIGSFPATTLWDVVRATLPLTLLVS